MDLSKLNTMSRAELVELAGTQGLKPTWNAKEATIIKMIVDHINNPPKPKASAPIQAAVPPTKNSPEEIEAAIVRLKEARPDFVSIYTDHTWEFRYRGVAESGNLSIPIRLIVRSAEVVARGPQNVRVRTEWDGGSAVGHSAYTNKILA